MGAHGECTREVMGAAPGTRLSWLGGRVGCSWGRVRGREGVGLLGLVSGRKLQGRVSRYSSSSVAPGGVYFIYILRYFSEYAVFRARRYY